MYAECEALRYDFLNNLQRPPASRAPKEGTIRVLVLSDYVPLCTIRMLRLIEEATSQMLCRATYAVKPHPKCPVMPEDYPSLRMTVITEPLGARFRDFDIAFASNLTSASVDAHPAGLPVVVMLSDTELNYSPLRGQPGVLFVSSTEDLAEALQSGVQGMTPAADRNKFFFLDRRLPRWRKLLEAPTVTTVRH